MNWKKYFFFCYLLSFEEYPDLSLRVWIETKGGPQILSLQCLPFTTCFHHHLHTCLHYIFYRLETFYAMGYFFKNYGFFFFFMLSCSTTHMFEVHVVYVYANTYKKKCVCKYISVFSLKVCSWLLFSICVWIHSDVAILCPETEGFFLTFLCLFYSDVAWILIIKYLVNHDFLAFLW